MTEVIKEKMQNYLKEIKENKTKKLEEINKSFKECQKEVKLNKQTIRWKKLFMIWQ